MSSKWYFMWKLKVYFVILQSLVCVCNISARGVLWKEVYYEKGQLYSNFHFSTTFCNQNFLKKTPSKL